MKMKKLIALLLSLVMVVGLLPAVALATDPEQTTTVNGITFHYTAAAAAPEPVIIGTYQRTKTSNVDLYLLSLPYGAEFQAVSVADGDELTNFRFCGKTSTVTWKPTAPNLLNKTDYIEDGEFKNPAESTANNTYYKQWIKCTIAETATIPTENVEGYFGVVTYKVGGTTTSYMYVIVQIATWDENAEHASMEDLQAEIAKVWDEASGDYTDNYYKENDRYNGKPGDTLTVGALETGTKSFWADFTASTVLSTARTVAANPNAKPAKIDKAYRELHAALAKLIPTTQVNATLLYEAANVKWYWAYPELNWIKQHTSGREPALISADDTTAATWNPYAAALAEATELFAALYDAEGEPTESNTAALQPQIEALATKLDVGKLISKEFYSKGYN